MKLMNFSKLMMAALFTSAAFTSCKNSDIEFPDNDGGTTVYFPYQYPVRTIVLGDDEYDTALDHAHKCIIKSTFGGSYNGSNGSVQVQVDKTLCNNLTFSDGTPVKVMPDNYYTLSGNTMNFNGTMNGDIEVSLSDAFFADADATKATYVIPLVMTSQTGFGKINNGTWTDNDGTVKTGADAGAPWRLNSAMWNDVPMDYVLYCVKFQNKYAGSWVIAYNRELHSPAGTQNYDFIPETVEKRTPVDFTTQTLNSVSYNVQFQFGAVVKEATLVLTFDNTENCVITTTTPGITVTGTGNYADDGAKQAWNQKDRDMIDIEYTIDFGGGYSVKSKENLIWQRSGVKTTEFIPVYTQP